MTPSGRQGWARAVTVAASMAAVALLAAACGSDSVSTTTGGTGGADATVDGPLVAKLSTSCSGVDGMAIDYGGNDGAATADAAVQTFLATAPAASLRGLTFDPARPPPQVSPPQSVVGSGAVTATTFATVSSPPATLAQPATQWYAHRDDDGRVTAVIEVDAIDGAHWVVGETQVCTNGTSAASTGTTMTRVPVTGTTMKSVPATATP